jgi:hypothetical protein
MKLLREYIKSLLTEVPLDDFGYVTPTKKDEPVIVKGELADYFKDIPQTVNVYVAHTDDLNWAQNVPSSLSGQLPDHMQGRGITQITNVGGVAKLYPQLAQKMDGSAINLLYVYSKTYLTSDEFIPDVNPHYIAHDLHHIFELQNRNREVGGVGEDKFKKIIKGYLDELLLATLGPHSDEYKAVSRSLGRIGRRFGVDKAEGRRFYSEIFPGYDFVSGDPDLLGDAFAAYLKSGKKIQLGIPTSWKGETGERKTIDRDIKIRNDAVTQAVASEWSKDLQDLLDTLMEPLVGKVGIFNVFGVGGKDKERAIELGKSAGRKKYPELFDYFDSQGAKFKSFRDYDERGKALVVEFPHPEPGEDVWKVEEYASRQPDIVAKLGDLGFDIVEASTGFGFDREGINLYLMPKKMKEGLFREYIRSLLIEDRASREQFAQDLYDTGVRDDQWIGDPETIPAGKERDKAMKDIMSQGRDLKKAFAKNADRAFLDSLVTVHWAYSRKSLEKLLQGSFNSRDEVSTAAYLPGQIKGTGKFGEYGVLVKGHITLLANDMDQLYTGSTSDYTYANPERTKMSGANKGAQQIYEPGGYAEYKILALDEEDWDPKVGGYQSKMNNEALVDNWTPMALIVPDGPLSSLPPEWSEGSERTEPQVSDTTEAEEWENLVEEAGLDIPVMTHKEFTSRGWN